MLTATCDRCGAPIPRNDKGDFDEFWFPVVHKSKLLPAAREGSIDEMHLCPRCQKDYAKVHREFFNKR